MTEGEFWRTLEEIGWLAALPDAERNRLRGALADAFSRDPQYAFYALAVTSFEPECIECSGPAEECSYYSVVSQLARASFGRFAPLELSDELDEEAGVARISFRHAGKKFECEVPWEDDWFQE